MTRSAITREVISCHPLGRSPLWDLLSAQVLKTKLSCGHVVYGTAYHEVGAQVPCLACSIDDPYEGPAQVNTNDLIEQGEAELMSRPA